MPPRPRENAASPQHTSQRPATRFASAVSDAEDSLAAVDQILTEITPSLPGPVDLAMVFATPHHRDNLQAISHRLTQAVSPRVLLGATAGGVIGRQREIEDRPGLSVLAASLPGATVHPFAAGQMDQQAALASPESVRGTVWPHDDVPKAVVLFADPFSTPMTQLLPTLSRLWPGVPVVGGMASAARQPGQNLLLLNGQTHRDGLVGAAIAGDIDVACTISQGCRPIGKPYVITKSHRHIVHELGGRNALAALEEMAQGISDEDRTLIQTRGLMVGRVINEYKDHFGRGDFLIRHLLAVDQDTGYIAINDPQVHTGQTVQFHVHDQQTAVEDFKLLLETQQLNGPACGALLFSCNGRGCNLFDQPNTDASLIHGALGDAPLAGFFAAGEIGPIGDQNFLHGHTASLIVFRQGQ